jgi:hypothetical protein
MTDHFEPVFTFLDRAGPFVFTQRLLCSEIAVGSAGFRM